LISRRPIALILLLVVAVRSLLPAGFMVQAANAETGAGFDIVICTSSGFKTITVDDDGRTRHSKPQHVDNGLCPFAAAGAAALAEAGPLPVIRAAEFAAVTFTLAVRQFAETPRPGATSARGPPSQVI
jgi:hypothetical protein